MIRLDQKHCEALSDEEILILKLIEKIKDLKRENTGLLYPYIHDFPFTEVDMRFYLEDGLEDIRKDPAYEKLISGYGLDLFEDDKDYQRDMKQLRANGYSRSGYPKSVRY